MASDMIAGATFNLAVLVACSQPEVRREYDGAAEVTVATPAEATAPTPTSDPTSTATPPQEPSGEVLPGALAPAPATARAVAPPAERGADATERVVLEQKPRPKWWGPFPRPKVTGFGGPMLQLTGLNGSFAAMVGVVGGLTIKQRVSIAGTAMWLLNPEEGSKTATGAPQRLNFNFGGLLLAVVFARASRVDFTVEGTFGGGGACQQNPKNGECYARTAMFVGQPGLGVHIKLAPIVRLALGLGYRFVVERSWSGPGGRHLGAPVGSILLEFGWF
jgi:hypothetical protein